MGGQWAVVGSAELGDLAALEQVDARGVDYVILGAPTLVLVRVVLRQGAGGRDVLNMRSMCCSVQARLSRALLQAMWCSSLTSTAHLCHAQAAAGGQLPRVSRPGPAIAL